MVVFSSRAILMVGQVTGHRRDAQLDLDRGRRPLMLEDAAADSGRRLVLRELRGQPLDHPEVLTIPETGYIKGALLEALD